MFAFLRKGPRDVPRVGTILGYQSKISRPFNGRFATCTAPAIVKAVLKKGQRIIVDLTDIDYYTKDEGFLTPDKFYRVVSEDEIRNAPVKRTANWIWDPAKKFYIEDPVQLTTSTNDIGTLAVVEFLD